MNKVNQYIKNLGKSAKLASIDVLKEFNPSVTSFVETNNELFKEINFIVRDRKQVLRRIDASIRNSKVYEAADVGIQSIFESIRTGDLYNTARAEAINKRAAGFNDDSEFGDFDFGTDDFDADFNFDDEVDITAGDAYISKSIEGTSRASTESICNSVIISGKHIVESNRISNQMQMMQNAEMFGKMNGSLSSINTNISQMAEMITGDFKTHANNSIKFYESSMNYQNQSLAYLKELAEMERNRYGKELEEEKKSSRVEYSDIVDANGIPDLKVYGQSIKNRAKAKLSNSGLDIAGLFGEDSNALLMMAASPLSFIPKTIIEKAIGNTVKNSMDELNKSIGSYFGAMILRINTLVKTADDEENPLLKALKENVLSIFGVENSLKTTFDTSNYNKGQTGWTGTDHKALTEVIPYYLRKILSATTNREEMVYDFDKGKFAKAREVKDSFKNMRDSASKNASSIVREDIEDMVSRDITFTRKEQQDLFKQESNTFFDYFFKEGVMFDPKRKKNKYDYEGLDISDTNFRILSTYFQSLPKSQQMAFSKNILEGRSDFSKRIEELEKQSDSIYSILGNEDSVNEFVKFHSKDDSTVVSKGMFENSLLVKDEFGYSVHTYLNRIYGTLLQGIKTYNINGGGIGDESGVPNDILNRSISIPNISSTSYTTQKVIEEQNKSKSFEDRQLERLEKIKEKGLTTTTYDELDATYDSDSKHIESILQTNIDMNNRKMELEKRSNSTNQKYKNWLDKSKDYYDKHPDEDPSILNRLLRADNVVDKLKVFGDKLSDVTKAPGKMVANIIDQVDTRLYESIFGVEDQMYKGKPVKGVLDVMIINVQESFQKLNTWLDDNILSPLKKKLDDHGGLTGIINKVLEPFGLNVDDINIFKKGRQYLFGNKETGEEGLFSPLMKQLKEDLISVFQYTKDTMKEVYSPIVEGIKDRTPDWMKDKYNETKEKMDNILNKPVDPEMKKAAEEAGIQVQGNEEALNNLDSHDIGALKLDRTKLALVHKDEAILPKNRFLNLIRRLAPDGQNMSEEELYLYYQTNFEKMKSPLLKGNKFKEKKDGSIQEQITFGERAQRKFDKKGIETGKITLVDEMVLELSKGITEVRKALFGTKGKDDKIDEEKLDDNFNKAITDLTDNYKEYLPKIGSSAIIGAGISIIPGVIGGPLLGASVGAGVALLKNSKHFQNYLFGEMGKDGERSGGLVSKETQKLMKQYLPDMGKYGLTGAVTGLITPFGPMGGLMIGSSLAYLKNNDRIREAMFGDEGLINKDRRQMLKKALPNVALATIGTLAAGPFGLMGNAALGAGLGLISTTDSFKEVVFGSKDKDGNYVGGILGGIREGIIEPLKNSAAEIRNSILDFIENDMIKPLTSAIQPIGEEIRNILEKTVTFIPNMLGKVAEKWIKDPIDVWLKEKLFEPAGKMLNGLFGALTKPIKTLISAPFKVVGAVGNSLRQRQIMQGRASYMSAEERLQWREDNPTRGILAALQVPGAAGLGMPTIDRFGQDDQTIAKMSLEESEQALGALKGIYSGSAGLDRETKKVQKKIYRDVNKFFNNKDKMKVPFMKRGARDNILKLINTGKLDEAKELIKYSKSRNGSRLDPDDIAELLAIIDDDGVKLKQLQLQRKLFKGKSKEELKGSLSKLELKNLSGKRKDIKKYIDLFESEVSYKQMLEKAKPGTDDEGKSNDSETATMVDTKGTQIVDVLKNIEKLLKGEKLDDNINKDNDESNGTEKIVKTIEKTSKETKDAIDNTTNATKESMGFFPTEDGLAEYDMNNKLKTPKPSRIWDKLFARRKKEEEEAEERKGFFSIIKTFFMGDKKKDEKSIFGKIFDFVTEHPILSAFIAGVPLLLGNLLDKVDEFKDYIGNLITGNRKDRQDAEGNNVSNSDMQESIITLGIKAGAKGIVKGQQIVDVGKSAVSYISKAGKNTITGMQKAGGKVANVSKSIFSKIFKGTGKEVVENITESAVNPNSTISKTLFSTIDDIGKKFIELLAKYSKDLGSNVKAFSKIGKIFSGLSKTIKGSKSLLAKATSGLMKGAVRMAPIIGGLFVVWGAASGATEGETANLFQIETQYVTAGMRVISAAIKALLNFGMFGPVLSILNDIVLDLTQMDFIHWIAVQSYKMISSEEQSIALDGYQNQLKQKYEQYKLDNNLPELSFDAYNDMTNKSLFEKIKDGSIISNIGKGAINLGKQAVNGLKWVGGKAADGIKWAGGKAADGIKWAAPKIGSGLLKAGDIMTFGMFNDENIRKSLGLNPGVKVNLADRAAMGASQLLERLTLGKVDVDESIKIINSAMAGTNNALGRLFRMTDENGNALSLTEGVTNIGKNIKDSAIDTWNNTVSEANTFFNTVSTKYTTWREEMLGKIDRGIEWLDLSLGSVFGMVDEDGNAKKFSEVAGEKISDFTNPIKKLWSGFITDASKTLTGIKETFTKGIDDLKTYIADLPNKIKNWFADKLDWLTDYSDSDTERRNLLANDSNNTNKRNNIRGRGFGNNSWKNIRYNNPNDNIKQTLGDSGCAPIAGSAFMNQLGMNVDPNEAANFAIKGGYKETDGGTDISFFGDYLNSKGINTTSIGIDNKNKSALKNTLKKNIPTILLGQSNSNDTFGPDGHYVVATGSNNGKVKITDPLNNKGVYETDMSKVLNQTNYAVVPSGKGLHSGGFIPQVVDTKDVTKTINNYGGYYEKPSELFKSNNLKWDTLTDSFYSFMGINKSNNTESVSPDTSNIKLDISKEVTGMENKPLTEFRRPTVGALNAWIDSYAPMDSPFRGKASIFLQASDESGLDPKYLVAHAALESGWGKSKIARTKHNYFGVAAYNNSPFESAMYLGTDLKSGIINGAKWIRDNYINRGQNTLYRMLYADPKHVYAVYDNGKPNDSWMNNIGKIMSHAQQSGLGKNKLQSSNLGRKPQHRLGNKKLRSGGFIPQVVNTKDVTKTINDYGGYYEKPIELFHSGKFDWEGLTSSFKSIFGIEDIIGNSSSVPESNIVPLSGNIDKFFLSQPGFISMTSDYGPRLNIYGNFHQGIDYAGKKGTPILSPINGVVETSMYGNSYGNHVIIKDTNGYFHYFAHLNTSSRLRKGDSVVYGKTIVGNMGNTGNVLATGNGDGTHLHYEVRKPDGKTHINPREYFKPRRSNDPDGGPNIGFGKFEAVKIDSMTEIGKSSSIGSKLYNDVMNTRAPKIDSPKYDTNKTYSKSGYGLSPITKIQQSTDQLRRYTGGALNNIANTNDTTLLKMIQSIIELLVQIVTNTQSNSEIIRILSEGLSIKIPESELKNIKGSDNVKQTALNLLQASLLIGNSGSSNDNSPKQSSVYSNMVRLASK